MPTYQYVCTECGGQLEAVQKFTDDALTVHEDCGGRLRKVFSPVGIVFKGSGFYRTDSRGSGVSGNSSTGNGSSPASDSPAKADAPAKAGGDSAAASPAASTSPSSASSSTASAGSKSSEKVA